MNKKYIVILIIVFFVTLGVSLLILTNRKNNDNEISFNNKPGNNANFDYTIIKKANNSYKENYMISPLSIGYALSILKDGASDNTKKEIENVLNDYKLPNIINIKDRVSLANALFIKNIYENEINKSYKENIKNNYDADIIFDEFNNPDKINNWVSDKTFKMINKTLDKIDPKFVLGIVNALAIDVEWNNKFECSKTRSDKFTLKNNSQIDAAFMNSSSGFSYFETNNAKGIVKNYKTYKSDNNNDIDLEYIAILPNDLDSYINNFSLEELNNIIKSSSEQRDEIVSLSLPKYTYDFNYDNFKNDLISLGIKEAFDEKKASFKGISTSVETYVDKAIHKSHIELSENGTKAAAVTAFIMNYKSSIDTRKRIEIKFDRPFIYLIKEKNSDNIWFFGTVYEPMKFEESTCETKGYE